MALGLALAWCMLLFTCTAQVQLSIKCDSTTSSLTLDPCAGISQHNLPAACATANAITLTNPALSTVHAVVQGDQVFAQGHPLNTTCTRRGCPFGMQHPSPMTNDAPFPCVACAPPDFQAVKQAKSQTASNQYKYYVACPKEQGDSKILTCPGETIFANVPGTDWILPSRADCESVAVCAVGSFRSRAGTCLPCPYGAAAKSPGTRFKETCLCPPGTQAGNDACATCEPGSYQAETAAAVICQSCDTAKLYGATSCESDTTCQNGVLRGDGVCLTRPTTVAAVFDLVASGQLAWADPDAPPDRGNVALRLTDQSIETADDLVINPAPTCSPSAGRDATGQCQPCPAGQRGNGGACEPVPCEYGDVELENRTCVLDRAYAGIMQHNVSDFCYPVRHNSTTATTCARCLMGHRTDAGRYDGAVNTLQGLWPPPPGPSPCHYRCESGYEERTAGEGCWPCLPGYAGPGCQACPAGTHSSDFRRSQRCLHCDAGKFSLGQQHVCTPCADSLASFYVWRALYATGCTASTTAQEDNVLANSSTPAMVGAAGSLCIDNVTFATDGIAQCNRDTDRVLGQCAANATRPNCIANTRVQSVVPDAEDVCNTDYQYTLDAGGCGNCSNHACASLDAYLVPQSCPPVCRSCLENASDGQDVVASSVRRIGRDACRLFCAEPFVAAEFLPADIQTQLSERPCVRVVAGPDLERVSNGQVRCNAAQGAKLSLEGGSVACKRPLHDCKRAATRGRGPGARASASAWPDFMPPTRWYRIVCSARVTARQRRAPPRWQTVCADLGLWRRRRMRRRRARFARATARFFAQATQRKGCAPLTRALQTQAPSPRTTVFPTSGSSAKTASYARATPHRKGRP